MMIAPISPAGRELATLKFPGLVYTPPRGRPKTSLVLTDDERQTLERSLQPPTATNLELRAEIVLACADGSSNVEVAEKLGITPRTVGKWRGRFVRERLGGLLDRPRSGAPRRIDDSVIQHVLRLTLSECPDDGSDRWSTRQMAARTGLGRTTIHRIWRAFGIAPHRAG